jgi:alanyl-tRNA synthetase
MQQHTGQHLLTAVAADRFGWETVAFHLGAEVSTIEVAAARPARARLLALEEEVAAEIRAAREVTTRFVTREEISSLGVRTRGLPEEHEGDVRLVEIAGVDLNTCGGTHLSSTAEIELVKLVSAEAHGQTSLLSFVCGGRARARFGALEGILSELRSVLQAPDTGLAEAARKKLEQLHAAERRVRDLSESLAGARAEALAASPGTVLSEHVPEADIGFLQEIARAFVPRAPGKALLLTGGTGESGAFVLALGESLPGDAPALGRGVADALGGRGGGSGRVFQGRAGALSHRENALAFLRGVLEAGGSAGLG